MVGESDRARGSKIAPLALRCDAVPNVEGAVKLSVFI